MTTFKTLSKTTLVPIALCLSVAVTTSAMAKKGQHQKHDGMRQILSELSLSDTQKQDIKLVLKQNREDRASTRTDDKSLRTQLRVIIQSTEWEQTAVESAITQHQAVLQAKALKRARNKNQVWNLLTDDQQIELVAQLETRKAKLKEIGSNDKRKGKGDRLKRLDLSAEQLAAVKTIRSSVRANSAEIKTSLKEYKQAERALIHSSEFNEQTWKALNAEYQADFLSMAVLKVKTKNDIWNLLTSEQKTIAAKEVRGKLGKRGKKGKRKQKDSV